MRFVGKRAVVTGGGTGIGAAITARLADEGAAVAVVQQTPEQAEAAARLLSTGNRRIHSLAADLGRARGCHEAVSTAADALGGVDILVNNAAVTGTPALAPFLETEDDLFDHIIDVNLKACFRCTRDAAGHMIEGGGGVVVNVSSVAAFAAQELAAAYAATKGAIESLTRACALELAPYGIRVVAVAPGDIVTGTSEHIRDNLAQAGSSGRYDVHGFLNRRGRPEEIAAAVAFLCSDEAGFITGTTLVVDGGFLAH
jgi:NAD(P)-dependent dehydrogenase (short-subunit alcohol dehydrogenase family)